MYANRQFLNLGIDALPVARADRVRAFRLLVFTAARMRAALDQALAASGMTMQQATLLLCVQAQTEAPTIGEVARTLALTHQNVKQLAKVEAMAEPAPISLRQPHVPVR